MLVLQWLAQLLLLLMLLLQFTVFQAAVSHAPHPWKSFFSDLLHLGKPQVTLVIFLLG